MIGSLKAAKPTVPGVTAHAELAAELGDIDAALPALPATFSLQDKLRRSWFCPSPC